MHHLEEFSVVDSLYSTINPFLIKLYRGAQETPMVDFKSFVFEHLQTIIQLDSWYWETYSISSQHIDIGNAYHFNPPTDRVSSYGASANLSEFVEPIGKKDVLFTKLNAHGMDRFEVLLLKIRGKKQCPGIYMYHSQREENPLQYVIIGLIINKHNLRNRVSFCRKDMNANFSDQEKLLLRFLIPHFEESLRINILRSFKQSEQSINSYRAVVDRGGTVIEAEDKFISLLNSSGLLVAKKIISLALLRKITSPKEQNFQVEGIRFKTSSFDNLTYMEAIQTSPLEQLTKRKMEIANLLMSGLSDKHIGKQLGISHHTVSNHLKDIYKILKFNSRAEVIAYLHQHEAIVNELSTS